jgi:hypothetical protein
MMRFAIQKDGDARLYDQFPEYPDLARQPGRERITVAHALSMTMGAEPRAGGACVGCRSEVALLRQFTGEELLSRAGRALRGRRRRITHGSLVPGSL